MKNKICTICKLPLPVSKFTKDKKTKDGLCHWCKICKNGHMDEYRKKYPWRRTLESIKRRCNNPNCKRYKDYGGRGNKMLNYIRRVKEALVPR